MKSETLLSKKTVASATPKQSIRCNFRAATIAATPSFFVASNVRIGNLNPEMIVPSVPTLPVPLMLISFLKRYYSGLMVEMGQVSQECRSEWQ